MQQDQDAHSQLDERVALAIMAAWCQFGEVPFPLYKREALALAKAAINALASPKEKHE